jgi:biopolymer transport protein ExbD
MKSFRRVKKSTIKPDIAPLLDVMFMLLLFFLLTSSFLRPAISLKLPAAGSREKAKNQDIIVSVDKEGKIFLNRDEVEAEELPLLLKQKLKESEKKKIIFQGDEKIFYKKFINLMGIIKSSGAKEISLAHEIDDKQ